MNSIIRQEVDVSSARPTHPPGPRRGPSPLIALWPALYWSASAPMCPEQAWRLTPRFPPIALELSPYFPPVGKIEVGKSLQTVAALVRPCPPLAERISCAGLACPDTRINGPAWAILGSKTSLGIPLGAVSGRHAMTAALSFAELWAQNTSSMW